MKILCIGDVVSKAGCEFLREKLPAFKRQNAIDVVIVNAENSANGNGITPSSAQHVLASGADAITTGNHVFKRPEFAPFLDEQPFVIRPANFPADVSGNGMCILDKGYAKIAVINLLGVVGLEPLDNPFTVIDQMIAKAKQQDANIIVLDFHAEATAEKKAMGFYLDGRISAMFGTHTHVQTADAQVLPNGTGYITDVGMTGPTQSVLGIDPKLAIQKLKQHTPVRFQYADTPCMLQGVVFEIDKQNGTCLCAQAITIE